jgi:hypothetical protein
MWATVIPSLAVPPSLLATFAVMWLAGFRDRPVALRRIGVDDRRDPIVGRCAKNPA